MKKIMFFGLAALMFGAVACDNIEDSTALPETNPQLPIVAQNSVTIVAGEDMASVIDLTQYDNENKNIQVAKVSQIDGWPEGFTPSVPYMEIADTETFEHNAQVAAFMGADGEVFVTAQDFEEAFKQIFGTAPAQRDVFCRFPVFAVNEAQSVRMGGLDTFFGLSKAEVIPFQLVLYTPGDSNGWNQVESQYLQPGGNDGEFWGFAYLTGGFKFSDAPNWDGTNYGDGGEGKLSTDGGAGNLSVATPGLYLINVNIEALTYDCQLISTWGMIGGFNGWGGDEALTPSDNFLVWTGTVTFNEDTEYKFRANEGWDINVGGSMDNLSLGGSNINATAGTYNVTLDFSKLPYSCKLVPASRSARRR